MMGKYIVCRRGWSNVEYLMVPGKRFGGWSMLESSAMVFDTLKEAALWANDYPGAYVSEVK